jgi:hypothetical protein
MAARIMPAWECISTGRRGEGRCMSDNAEVTLARTISD